MTSESEKTVTGGVTPLFVKHRDLGLDINVRLSVLDFCKELYHVIDRKDIEGAQRIRGLWRIYLNNQEAKTKLYTNGFTFRGMSVTIYEHNPFLLNEENNDPTKKLMKVFVQNLPLSVSNQEIELMLRRLGCKMEGNVKYEYERDENGHLTSIKNGNRSVLVNEEYTKSNALPRNSYCGNWRCRIYHPGQPKPIISCHNCFQIGHFQKQCTNARACKVCHKPGHVEGEKECEHYQENDAVVFQGEKDHLSNFYPCNFVWKNMEVSSAEHAYVFEKAVNNGRPDIGNDVLKAENALEAKRLSHKIYTNPKWEEKSTDLMKEILKEKAEQLPDIKATLMKTGDSLIAEAVPYQNFWSCGLNKTVAAKTDPDHWPGCNKLGELWMDIRDEYVEEDEATDGFTITEGSKPKNINTADDNESQKRKLSGDSANTGNLASKQRPNGSTPPKIRSRKRNDSSR